MVVGISIFFISTQRVNAPVITQDVSLPSQTVASSDIVNTSLEMIEVISPLPNSALVSPLTITGRARGPWYFEASFPIELRDANNVLIAKTVAQAQGDWMTEDFVPFTATLTFPLQPAGSQGMLTFKNDNPSGEPQNSMMFDVPVVF